MRAGEGVGAGEAAELTGERDHFHCGQSRNKNATLGKVSKAQAQLVRAAADWDTEYLCASARGLEETEQCLEERALSGAVGTEQSGHAFGHFDVESGTVLVWFRK